MCFRSHVSIGGECSYWACSPSKSLRRPGEAVHGAREAAASAEVNVGAALAWRDFMVSDYSDAGRAGWLADQGRDLLPGGCGPAGPGRRTERSRGRPRTTAADTGFRPTNGTNRTVVPSA